MDERTSDFNDYVWEHFRFNAEQRLKAFNFFVVFSVFANGGIFTAFEKNAHAVVVVLLGAFVVFLSLVFMAVDRRSRELLQLAVPALKEYERSLPQHARLFTVDESRRGTGAIRYTTAFGWMFKTQSAFGLLVVAYGMFQLLQPFFGPAT